MTSSPTCIAAQRLKHTQIKYWSTVLVSRVRVKFCFQFMFNHFDIIVLLVKIMRNNKIYTFYVKTLKIE